MECHRAGTTLVNNKRGLESEANINVVSIDHESDITINFDLIFIPEREGDTLVGHDGWA